jgi:hypothetical protein
MTRKSRSSLLLVLILPTLPACDNVSWGGAEFAIVPPPTVSAKPATNGKEIEEHMPSGPVLYYVANRREGAIMVPVGEITGDSMLPIRARADAKAFAQRLIAEHLRQGSEFTLYHLGSRVGTLVVQSATPPEPNVCPALPRALGALELQPGVDSIPEFLAISSQHAPEIRRRAGAVPEISRTMQVLAPILAEKMIRARHAELPSNWQRAMAQLRPFPVTGGADPGYATTFVVSDTLGLGADNMGYSLFYIGTPAQFSYDTVFVAFTDYPSQGKAAPRVVDYLDWTRDDQPELLLQVYGINDTWFEVVGKKANGRWERTFRDRCARGGNTVPAAPTPDSVRTDSAR